MSLGDAYEAVQAAITADLDAEVSRAELSGVAWRIENQGQADWALRKLLHARRVYDNHAEVVAAEKRVLNDFLRREAERRDVEVEKWAGHLEAWHRRVLERDPDAKTLRFPAGVVAASKRQDDWRLSDEFIEWAQRFRPELLRVKVEPERQLVKRRLSALSDGSVVDPETGERVPGVSVEVMGADDLSWSFRSAAQTP